MCEINGLDVKSNMCRYLPLFTFVGTLSLLTLSVSYNILFLVLFFSPDNCQTGGKTDTVTFAP